MRTILVLFVTVFSSYATAQQQGRYMDETSALMTDAMGQPIYTQQKYNWEGKIFFPDNYSLATITSASGKTYRNIKAKLNLLDNAILFTDSARNEFTAVLSINRIVFEDPLTNQKITLVKADTGKAMYQLLDSGKVCLLKKIILTYKDQVPYGSTMVTRVFEQKFEYYSFDGIMVQSLDRNKPSLLQLMKNKSAEVSAFIENEKIRFKKEDDLVKLFSYYNSLP